MAAKPAEVEFIPASTTLRDKVARIPGFEQNALARAGAAMQVLAGRFDEWMDQEAERLQAARMYAKERRWSEEALLALYLRAHDAKGLGGTYGFPLVTEISASLCLLLESPENRAKAATRPALIEAHVDAVRVMVAQKVKVATHPMGVSLCKELVSQTSDLIG
jgi:hypothetical protein